jgi:hypothetical protein
MPSLIKVSPFSKTFTEYKDGFKAAIHDWPDEAFLQGGDSGVVLTEKGSYRTAFVEAFVNGTFIRGEGSNLDEAEEQLWQKYQATQTCNSHEYVTRGYTNGAGFCVHCSHFQPDCFSAEDLKQYCNTCNVPTKWGQASKRNKETHEWEKVWACKEHIRALQTLHMYYLLLKEDLNEKERIDLTHLRFLLLDD